MPRVRFTVPTKEAFKTMDIPSCPDEPIINFANVIRGKIAQGYAGKESVAGFHKDYLPYLRHLESLGLFPMNFEEV